MDIPSERALEILLGLGIACISFLAGQVWGLGKTLYRRRKLKRALQTEIGELQPWLLRNLITIECMIQLSCLQELANHGPVPLPVQIHAEHFPEINLDLSRAERTSINAIYSLVYRINEDSEKLTDLNPLCARDSANFHQLRQVLDRAYRNSHHVLVLIRLHLENIDNLAFITTTNETDRLIHELEARNDADLLKLAAEARKEGAAAIRRKYKDGAVSVSEITPTPAPVPGHFYFDATGAKYKCLSVQDGIVSWMQLESKIGALTFDAVVRQPLASVRHCYEITDSGEMARLNRRCAQLTAQINSRKQSL
jgi:hypothetical protein